MSLPVDLRAALLADGPVAALVAARVYPVRLPQEPTFPAITYEMIAGNPNNPVDGIQPLHWARVRINAWGEQHADAVQLGLAIETALNGKRTATLHSIRAYGRLVLFEPSVAAHYHLQDFSIWHL